MCDIIEPMFDNGGDSMEIMDKVKILADSAKYDASCSSCGGTRKNKGGIGNSHFSGICHSWSEDGRCVSLLKLLFSNCCIYDCAYCHNRKSNDVPRAQFTPEELANLTMEFYKRNYIEGLFLSSAVVKSPDYTMELFLKTLKLLRYKHKFFGYIHVKIIPGTNELLVKEIGELADRVSVNIEFPSSKSLNLLAPDKTKEAILTPMKQIKTANDIFAFEKKKYKNIKKFAPAGQTTQMIIGATPESDLQIMRLTEGMYKKFSLRRVYYSAYIPVGNHPALPSSNTTPALTREHRLYQADWLLRFYGFSAEELLDEHNPNFSSEIDPKCTWAIRHPEFFPIDVNKASYEELLRVPGIGVLSAKRILTARKCSKLRIDDLKKLGVVLKRAKYFITAMNSVSSAMLLQSSPAAVVQRMISTTAIDNQISFFDTVV